MLRRGMVLLGLALALFSAGPVHSQSLDRLAPDRLGATLARSAFVPLRGQVAVEPPDPAELPIAGTVAQDVLDDALAALVRAAAELRSEARLTAIVQGALRDRIAQIWRDTADKDARQAASDALLKAASVDLKLVGAFRCLTGALEARLRLLSVGVPGLASQTGWERLADRCDQTAAAAVTLDGFIASAAEALAPDLAGARMLYYHGLTRGESGVHTAFGREVARRLAAALIDRRDRVYRGALAGGLRAERIDYGHAAWERIAAGADAVTALVGADSERFLLEGSYTLQGDGRGSFLVFLRGQDGDRPWQRPVHGLPADLDREAPLPRPLELFAEAVPGPFGLRLVSDRGEAPDYRIGEDLRFGIALGTEAYVQCFTADDQENVARILPNRFLPLARLGVHDTLLLLPDQLTPEGYPAGSRIRWPLREPPGVMVIKCVASSRPILPRLPADLQDLSSALLEGMTVARLLEVLRSSLDPNDRDEASLTVTVSHDPI